MSDKKDDGLDMSVDRHGFVRNKNGLTWRDWKAAAKCERIREAVEAWTLGEDPAEWRKK